MNLPKFAPGDIVQLKSGGPKMTVQRIHPGDYGDIGALCVWFNGAEKRTDWFNETTLDLCPKEPIRIVAQEANYPPYRGGGALW